MRYPKIKEGDRFGKLLVQGIGEPRIDVYGNYTPENCRWVDRSVSNYNRRKLDKNVSGRTGVYWHGASMMWVVECQRGRESRVVKYFNSFEEAVNFRKQLEFDMYEEFKPEDREV